MATQKYEIESGDGWVQIAASGEDFTAEMQSTGTAFISLSDTAPGESAPSHHLTQHQILVRPGLGAAYAKAPTAPIVLVVTT
jgi:hypothetical protein